MSLSITHGRGQAWHLTGFLMSDGTYRRLVKESNGPAPRSTEPPGYVLERFAGARELPVWSLILDPSSVVGLHPVLRRRQRDPKRHTDGPTWSWLDPVMAVVGQPNDRDVRMALQLKAESLGLI